MIQAQINIKAFVQAVTALSSEEMERVAVACPDLFGKDCFDIVLGGVEMTAPARPAKNAPDAPKPRERKPREPKELSDREVEIVATVYAYLRGNGESRLAEIAEGIGANKPAVTAALKVLDREGKVRHNDKKGAGAKYAAVEQVEA